MSYYDFAVVDDYGYTGRPTRLQYVINTSTWREASAQEQYTRTSKNLQNLPTSMSSLFGNKGALISCLSWKVSDSTSNVTAVMVEILSQWRCFMALWAIISRRGQHSLKSSIVFLRSRKACHSFKAFGNFRILEQKRLCFEPVFKEMICL